VDRLELRKGIKRDRSGPLARRVCVIASLELARRKNRKSRWLWFDSLFT
jgi:hypothetical protein